MSSAFERLQKVAEEKRKAKLKVVEPTETLPEPTPTNHPQVVPTPTNHPQVIPNTVNLEPVSPIRNFTKVANSITNEALPKGLFKGLSKHTYDVLYKLTRGAIKPNRFVQITQRELMRLTGLSENTLRSHIKYLNVTGLIIDNPQMGKHEGTIYEVLLPEEVAPLPTTTNPSQVVPSSNNYYQPVESSEGKYQTLAPDTSQDLVLLGTTKVVENKAIYSDSKTSFKTLRQDDDESALNEFIKVFENASQEFTNKGLNKKEKEKWGKLAELLVMELKVAALRTDSISSIPAFLTEHLRRRLQYPNLVKKQQKSAKGNYKKDTVGKSDHDSETIEVTENNFELEDKSYIEKLNEKQKETVLASMKEFISQGKEDFVMSLRNTYTEEDWNWLMEALNK